MNLFHFAAPARFHDLAGRLVPWFGALAIVLAAIGLYIGFFVAPTDAQQGEAYRIIFVHVPTAWMSMVVYLAMAMWAAAGLIFNSRLSSMMACALAPTGALMTFLALWTGALWGKPMWGTWWVWDARLTSELILFFLYLGYMALHAAIDDPRRADRAGARDRLGDHLVGHPPHVPTAARASPRDRRVPGRQFRRARAGRRDTLFRELLAGASAEPVSGAALGDQLQHGQLATAQGLIQACQLRCFRHHTGLRQQAQQGLALRTLGSQQKLFT